MCVEHPYRSLRDIYIYIYHQMTPARGFVRFGVAIHGVLTVVIDARRWVRPVQSHLKMRSTLLRRWTAEGRRATGGIAPSNCSVMIRTRRTGRSWRYYIYIYIYIYRVTTTGRYERNMHRASLGTKRSEANDEFSCILLLSITP